MNQNDTKSNVAFAAIDRYIERNIILPTERLSSKDYVEWGEKNLYPHYLLDLFNNVTTLHAIIGGNIDFTAGDEIIWNRDGLGPNMTMNLKGDTIEEQVRNLAKDYNLYGGFALQIIRNRMGEVAEIYYIDLRFLRTNKENDVFYYSEKWDKDGLNPCVIYPAYMPDLNWQSLDEQSRARHASSILFVKNVNTQVYPSPLYAAAVKACEIERGIDDFHLNNIENGFTSSAIVNFNNGEPTDAIKREIEETFNEKFSGHQNAGRIMFSWNKDRMSATTIEAVKTENFVDKYNALAKHSRQQIFSAFRAIPLLFGLTSEVSTGFSTDEFEQSFKLYNRTQIRPVQRKIVDAYEKIFQEKGVITIKPFTLDGSNEKEVD